MEGAWPRGWEMATWYDINMRQEKQAFFRVCVDPYCYSRVYTLGDSRRKGWARRRRLREELTCQAKECELFPRVIWWPLTVEKRRQDFSWIISYWSHSLGVVLITSEGQRPWSRVVLLALTSRNVGVCWVLSLSPWSHCQSLLRLLSYGSLLISLRLPLPSLFSVKQSRESF